MAKLEQQKKQDDTRIALVYEALNRGIEIENDDLYYGMLETYPFF